MQRLGEFLLMLAACLVFSIPATGCSLNNGEYMVTINSSYCPPQGEGYWIDGWQKITFLNFTEIAQVKLLKAGPNDSVAALNWTESASSYMKQKGGSQITTEIVEVSGMKGIKTVASFYYGKSILIDVPLEDNNLLEVMSRDALEGERSFAAIRKIEKLNMTSFQA